MSSPTLYRDLVKIIRVMKSCTKQYQFEIAIRMFYNWKKLNSPYNKPPHKPLRLNEELYLGREVVLEISEIAKKFGYDFRANRLDFIHVDNSKYEPLDEE